jgi:hypothetical protein
MHFDDPKDPAMEPVNEAGGGESEGFEMAEEELIEHASHGEDGGTARITSDASHIDEELDDEDLYGDADEEIDDDD